MRLFRQADKDTARKLEAQSELKRFIETQRKQPGLSRLKQKDSRKFFRALGAAEDFMKDADGKSAADFKAKMRETESVVTPLLSSVYDGGEVGKEDQGEEVDGDEATSDEL